MSRNFSTTKIKKEIQNLLKKYSLSPKKFWGQNFLISREVYQKIIKAARLSKRDTILEVGAGTGTLTKMLSFKAKKVVAVEKDKDLFQILREETKGIKNIKCIAADIRRFNPAKYNLKKRRYKIVANLPYYLTSYFLRIFLEKFPPKEMILLLQKEVAEKIIARKKESLLSLSVKFFAQAEIITFVKRENFWPKPKVDSALLRLEIKERVPFRDKQSFFKILHVGFSSPRKKLINNLTRSLRLEKKEIERIFKALNIPLNSRPGDLSLENWICLTKKMLSVKIKK